MLYIGVATNISVGCPMTDNSCIVGNWRSLEDSIADFKGKNFAKTMDGVGPLASTSSGRLKGVIHLERAHAFCTEWRSPLMCVFVHVLWLHV